MPVTSQEENIHFYDTHYDIIGQWLLRPGDKVMLGDKSNRRCRFCGKTPPEVTFKKVAHAIPESLGNKSIESAYECDTCNELFGNGIENDLGNWSKPTRTLVRIRGKSGVPTLKKGGDGQGWRVEFDQGILNVTAYENDPIFEVNEEDRKITFRLRRDAYTPVAVLKAFMKIGLTLMPDSEVANFQHLMAWVRCTDNSKPFADQCPVIYTFQPGPMPNDLIAALVLRRKSHVTDVPYAFLVLGYGNEVFQVPLPSKPHDEASNGKSLSILPFPVPGSPDPARYGIPKHGVLNLTGKEVVRGDIATMTMGYDTVAHRGHTESLQNEQSPSMPDQTPAQPTAENTVRALPPSHNKPDRGNGASEPKKQWIRSDRLAAWAIAISVFSLVATSVASYIAYVADKRAKLSDVAGAQAVVADLGDKVQLLAQDADLSGTFIGAFLDAEKKQPEAKDRIRSLEFDFIRRTKLPDLKLSPDKLAMLSHGGSDGAASTAATCATYRDELEADVEGLAAMNPNDWTLEQTTTLQVFPYRFHKLSGLCNQAEKGLSLLAPAGQSSEPLRGTLGELDAAREEEAQRKGAGFTATLQLAPTPDNPKLSISQTVKQGN
ncbi:HNH endonuclease [Paraburkholderia silvatlantica]|uniref:HNH endonuclease 5 domain-containing protein n=1 Tax=Paraburkholderia silvatlantica TaxID=321895 RepID=A0ABR6FQX4_9BURK|nr:HNH endonuclease [Paraburkholderia silvatlantica]MBB2929830.1 hypothetical protein [Paraburkholderia silvatlantica]PVY34873.1 HNH endonuclease [Paraburkholderia silvatlantica]PXW39283.1 HNH endonuclease [Paraburkholderia silvatlantica]